MTPPLPGFTGSPLDRADAARHDPSLVEGFRADPSARLLRLDALDPIVTDGALGWEPVKGDAELALLGLIEGVPRFVALTPGVSALRRSSELFAAIAALPSGEAATYAAARSLVDWHARHRFCANCGAATAIIRAGWGRHCDSCGAQHFPRTDPVVIMLAEHGEGSAAKILLGRQASFPPGRYSALAGFVEPGESIEEAVARETLEEAGVHVTDVRYVASQPWPFPSQLMIACLSRADDDRLTIDHNELEDARWATRAEVRAALAGAKGAPFGAPPVYAIAHTLLARWAGGGV